MKKMFRKIATLIFVAMLTILPVSSVSAANLGIDTIQSALAVAETTYIRSHYFDTIVYQSVGDTFPVSTAQSITISWTGGNNFNIYLRNNTSGNITSIKSSSSSVTYTSMNPGDYTLVASKRDSGSFTQEFTIKVY